RFPEPRARRLSAQPLADGVLSEQAQEARCRASGKLAEASVMGVGEVGLVSIRLGHVSLALLPCFPFQNGQNGQSSPWGKSGPSSCGQPIFPWLIATCLTACWRKKSFNSCCTFTLVVTSVATHRWMIVSARSWRITPAAIFVVVL